MLTAMPSPAPVSLTVQTAGTIDLDDAQLFEFCSRNRELRVERTAAGELILMSPTGGKTSNLNLKIAVQLAMWTEEDGRGVAFDSSGGFLLPNGAMRSPDAAWVEHERLKALSPEERERFLPLSPTLVIELRSPSDALPSLQAKMVEYLENGTRLGWLIDPLEERVHVYEAGNAPRVLEQPAALVGPPVLPGLTLTLDKIWNPDW